MLGVLQGGGSIGIRRWILLVLTIFILLGYMLACMHNFQLPDFVKPVYAAGPAEDYVDLQSNVDGVADKGTHSNFENQKATDSTYDTMAEADQAPITGNSENFVDNSDSDVDTHTGHGTHSSFPAMQAGPDSTFDTLTEALTSGGTSNVFTDGFEGGTFGMWDGNGATTWTNDGGICINGTNLEGWVSNSHSGTYYAGTGATGDGELETDNIDLSGVTQFGVRFWYAADDTEANELQLYFWDGAAYDTISSTLVDNTNYPTEDTWVYWSMIVTDNQYFDTTFRMQFIAACGNGEAVYVDDVVINKTLANNYELDLEFQWTTADFAQTNEYLCIYTGTVDAEALKVDVRNGGSWTNIIASLTVSQWNNVSIGTYLTGATITFRFLGGTESSDTTQSTWQIDVAIIHVWTQGVNYELELEEQFTDAEYSRTYEELCIKMGTMDAETLSVQWWNSTSSTWVTIIASLIASQWNNISVTAYLTSATFTIRFIDGTKTSDTTQSSWLKDATLLHTWEAGYALNLRVMDWDLTDAISGAIVYKDTDTLTSNANGWANWTLVSGTVQIKVKYFGFWVNGTFSVTMDSDKTIDVRCRLYDVTITVQESIQSAYLVNANVTVFNSTSTYGNRIKTGITGNNGQVALTNLPNNTLTFTQYGKSDWSLVIGNITQLVNSQGQSITLTSNQNSLNSSSLYSIPIGIVVGIVVPLKGHSITKCLKRKAKSKKR